MIQNQVQTYPSKAVPGDRASGNPVVYKVPTPQASGNVLVGSFVFAMPDGDPTTVKQTTSNASNAGVMGFVERVQTNINYAPLTSATLVVPDGDNVTVAAKGDFYCKSLTTATVGQKVFAQTTAGGGIKTGAAGATISDYVETDFSVKVGAAIGEIVTISNW